MSLIRGRIYNRTKKADHDGGKGGTRSGDRNDLHSKTSAKLATQFGVGEATIKRDGQFAKAVESVKKAEPDIDANKNLGKKFPRFPIASGKNSGTYSQASERRAQDGVGLYIKGYSLTSLRKIMPNVNLGNFLSYLRR